MAFVKAIRAQKKLRMGLAGPPGSGKTFTALRFAFALGKRVAVIDTENGSASLYAGCAPDGVPFDFDVNTLTDYSPATYTAAINEAGAAGYDVLVVDSFTHAWAGEGGALDIHTDATQKSGSKNSYFAWREVTPLHNGMIEAALRSPCHIIGTLRSKVEYVLEEEIRDGVKRNVPKQLGMKPIQREGMEYEFDIFGDIEKDTHLLKITKSRCSVVDGKEVVKAGAEFIKPILDWLNQGETVTPEVVVPTAFDELYQRLRNVETLEALTAIGKDAKKASDERKLKSGEMTILQTAAKKRKEELATANGKSHAAATVG